MKQATAKGWFYEIVYKSSLAGNTPILYIIPSFKSHHFLIIHLLNTGTIPENQHWLQKVIIINRISAYQITPVINSMDNNWLLITIISVACIIIHQRISHKRHRALTDISSSITKRM